MNHLTILPTPGGAWRLALRDESDPLDPRWLLVQVISAEPVTASLSPPLGWLRSMLHDVSATATPLRVPMPAWRIEDGQ